MPDPHERVRAMAGFAAVGRRLNFALAARDIGLSPSALSRRVADLEDRLGVRLLERTTRRVTLTEAGRGYLEQCEDILARVDAADDLAELFATEPRGTLRVSAATAFGEAQVTPRLPGFTARYPKLKLDLSLTDRKVDLLAAEADLAIRIGRLDDSGLVARRLATCKLVLCASPAYVAACGAPAAPADLAQHKGLHFEALERGTVWHFSRAGVNVPVTVHGTIRIDSTQAVRQMALSGLGVAVLATFVVGDDLAAGRLIRLLPDWTLPEFGIFALHPGARLMPPKVRVFIDYFAKAFAGTPPWDRTLSQDGI